MRTQPRRLVSTAVAIALGVAFLAATLLTTATLTKAIERAAAGVVGDAVAVVEPGSDYDAPGIPQTAVDALAGIDGVDQVRPVAQASMVQTSGGRQRVVTAETTPPLSSETTLTAGGLPERQGEVAINAALADAADLSVGDDLFLEPFGGEPVTAHIVGIVEPGLDATPQPSQAYVYASSADVMAWGGLDGYSTVYLYGSGDPQAVRDAALAVTGIAGTSAVVRTGADQVEHLVDRYSQGGDELTAFLLAIVSISLFVSALVIANSFAIMVTQRTQQLALLRCVGATRGQVFGMVVREALVVAVVASAAGVGLGVGLGAVLLTVLGGSTNIPVTSVAITWPTLVVPVLVGTAVTVVAALAPARRATRVLPVAALRPLSPAPARSRAGIARIAVGTVLVVGGAAALVVGYREMSLASGILGGLVSFVGVLMVAGLVVPALVRLVGAPLRRLAGAPAELAVGNVRRNPGRAASTASALLVGVTLITTLVVGAATGQATVNRAIDEEFPTDVQVSADESLDDAMIARIGQTEGVAAVERVAASRAVTLEHPDGQPVSDAAVMGVGPQIAQVLRFPGYIDGLDDGVVLLDESLGVSDGERLTATSANGSITLVADVSPDHGASPVVTLDDLTRLDPQATVGAFVRFDDGSDPATVIDDLNGVVGQIPGGVADGPAIMREQIQQVIDAVLVVLTGLLAISVVIALVGVGNTLGLSVIERTQEIGLLRAIGGTRAQVRSMFSLEAVLLALVSGLLGIGLGIGYGIAGVGALLSDLTDVAVDLPWPRLLLVFAVAVVAGWVASIVPARRAASITPTAAMVAE
ncbi:hypothetical protein GCM10009785_13040 [Brooklawnia cerclae]|uniref:ABC transport system permease protein n=1 Tax=Brooklawnia cerclae TaxID=349934 RepID=A0ABX0SPP7_9ACTN|nr:putative ABC transport system permease protein [Brooklawnia cerclae]